MLKHLRPHHVPFGSDNFLSVLEGVEGGFAIFAGIVAGLSFQHISRELLIYTALIGIIVNAFNSSAVRYTSEHFLDELDGHEKHNRLKAYLLPAMIEFLVYGAVSFISILPLLIIHDDWQAVLGMIILTLIFLSAAGWYRGRVLYGKTWRDSLEVTTSGGLIVVIGGMSGWLISLLIA